MSILPRKDTGNRHAWIYVVIVGAAFSIGLIFIGHVYKVAVAYIVAGWALSQGIAQVFPVFDVPNWAIRMIVLLIVLGFPVAVVFAWFFEITPEGVKRTEVADAMPKVATQKKRAWIYVVVIGAAISIALFFLGRYTARNKTATAAPNDIPSKSIAVLPFENLSEDKSNAYFRRRRAGRNPDTSGQSGRSESDLAHVDAAIQERA